MSKLGIVASAESHLRKGGLEVAVFDDVEPDPSINTVMKAVEDYKESSPDIIVGLGGGSSVDASKAVRIFLEHTQLAFEDVRAHGGRPAKTAVPPLKNTIREQFHPQAQRLPSSFRATGWALPAAIAIQSLSVPT